MPVVNLAARAARCLAVGLRQLTKALESRSFRKSAELKRHLYKECLFRVANSLDLGSVEYVLIIPRGAARSAPVWPLEMILRSIVDGCMSGGEKGACFSGFKRTWVTRVTGFWHNLGLQMTKTELQSALAEATQTDKRTAGVFLDTLSALAYKEIRKNGEFVLPGFGKLVKQKRKARTGFNPKTQQKIKIPAKTVVKFRIAKAAKDGVLGVKK